MAVRIVEGQLPYTGGTGIDIDGNKVISLLLREEDNLILVNDDNEIYTDLQLADGIAPTDEFPVGVTVGKVLQTDGWSQNGLILNWKTTSGDYARWLYGADGEIYFDGGNGTRRQVYYSSEVDALFTQLRSELATVAFTGDYNDLINRPAFLQQQADWDQTDTDAPDYIKNKPTIPTVNDATLTIQKNGISQGSFTANSATNTTVNIAVPNVINNVTSTSTTDALSANQGKNLQDQIDNLKAMGRFLSLWDCATGLPISFPLDVPYNYSTGDYFLVENISTTTNYRPNGIQYAGTASTTVETDEVEVGDMYIYDGTVWLLQINHGKSVSFANLAGQPSDNAALATALNEKENKLTAGDNITITRGLPEGYTKLDYIESDGTQGIDTGIILNNDSKVELDFQLTDLSVGNGNSFFGGRQSTTGRAYTFSTTTAGEWRIGWNASSPGYTAADLDRHTIVIDGLNLNVTLDGVQLTTLTAVSFTTPLNAALFAIRASTATGWYYGYGRLYDCKIYADGVNISAHFIPVKRDSDDVIGMYDTIRGMFYVNDGTGDFIEGPESSGYIGETIISANNTEYSSATKTTAGIVKLGSDTVQTQYQNTPTSTAGKTYAVQANSNGEMVVNVPWTDTATTVDSALSPTSTNPVENRIINSALNNKQDTLIAGTGISVGEPQPDTKGPCGDGFHIPLDSEWTALYSVFTTLGGTSTDGANFRDYFKLPYAGGRGNSNASEDNKGSYGYYWSATASGIYAKSIRIRSAGIQISYDDRRSYGFSIRPFKNTPVVPTSSWTTVLDGSSVATGAGIFWSEDDGLISLSSDGTNWITISDKNLGATTAWTNGDTLSEANCGKYYQWGNNYGFAFTGTLTTSSTRVNTSSYGPGNYYSGDTFITTSSTPFDWSNPANDNLWGGESQGEWTEPVISNTGVLSVNGQTGDVTLKTINGISLDGSGNIIAGDYQSGTGIAIGKEIWDTRGPCGEDFHIPTAAEATNLLSVLAGINVARGGEIGTYLKIPRNGYRGNTTGNITNNGTYFWLWTSSVYDLTSQYAYTIRSTSTLGAVTVTGQTGTGTGCSIRPFRNTPIAPDETWTTLRDAGNGQGIFHNPTEGLISIVAGQVITIADKNLGATTVWNNGDTVTSANSGYYYQWGNNYGFPGVSTATITTTNMAATLASGYGPGNYYSGSPFIILASWIDANTSTDNIANLWGGYTNGRSIVPGGNVISNTGVITVNGRGGSVTVNEVPSSGTTGYVLTKTANSYQWSAAPATGITNDTTGTTTTVTKIWAGTESEYNALTTHDASTIYHIY